MSVQWYPRHCQDCGRPCKGVRCKACFGAARPRNDAPRPLQSSWAERQRRARTVKAWIAVQGLYCPGWGVAPHPVAKASDLAADHALEVSRGGDEHGELGILCRRCNGRKGSTLYPSPAPAREQRTHVDLAW